MTFSYNAKTDALLLQTLLTSKPLERLVRASQCREQLTHILQEVIPPQIMKDITASIIDGQQLTIGIANSKWTTHLRALRNDILFAVDRCRQLGHLKQVKIVVRPPDPNNKKQKKAERIAPRPPINAAETVNSLAEGCSHDRLKMSLKRLAANMDRYRQKG